VAFTGFVIAGYLVPISWTGFSNQKLWNRIELLVLPAALAITAALTSRGIRYQGRLLRPYEMGMVIALVAGWTSGNAAERTAMAHEAPMATTAGAAKP
jgi:hypothetical protein